MNRVSLALVAATLAALSLSACSESNLDGAGSAASDSSTEPVPTTTIAAPAVAEVDTELPDQAVVAEILQLTWSSLEDPTVEVDLSEILTDTALEDFDNQRVEMATNDLHQTGKATIVSTEIEPGAEPETALAKVCVDSTKVEVLDDAESVVNEEVAPEHNRTLTLATFAHEDGVWKLAEQTYPDDPNC